MKKCTKCLEEKELKAYDKNRNVCRRCRNKKNTKSWLSKEGNLEKMREYQKVYQKSHREENDYYKVYIKALNNIRYRLKSNKVDVVEHFEKLFHSGMTLSNYGELWEIDHIISATKMAKLGYDISEINKLENLRPMLVKENRQRFKEE